MYWKFNYNSHIKDHLNKRTDSQERDIVFIGFDTPGNLQLSKLPTHHPEGIELISTVQNLEMGFRQINKTHTNIFVKIQCYNI